LTNLVEELTKSNEIGRYAALICWCRQRPGYRASRKSENSGAESNQIGLGGQLPDSGRI
jgi:hypothetical protein